MAVFGSGTSPDQVSPNSLLGGAAFVNNNDLAVQYAPVLSLDMIRGATGIESKYIIVDDAGIIGLFRYDSSDTTTADNNATVLVTSDGRRYKPVVPGRNGTTANRPGTVGLPTGYPYYDTTLGKPIWWNGSAWKDAANSTV
ncbi:hypothetical protein [Arsenicibacter rosenii]|uniref:Uncharacterized protein n=1 Tax=Arsenicibacter rosenii TaxID=1750698 RepID=A0A1S2VCS2_9BACT|nr:hypothetical protein [Arsenicibacter rosenii]OIN55728.1 hypothetical protein BLX24_28345 [Arsenicibacter rosenii]